MLDTVLQWLQGLSAAMAIREGEILFPWIESVHVLALTLVLGSIAIVDLRLIGLASRERSVLQTTASALPLTWSAFVVAAVTGGLLFASNATVYGHNRFFQAKLVLIALAGINMAVYHLFVSRGCAAWHTAASTPRRARVVGALSLCLWIAVAACGRWIGFTINTPM